MSVVFFHVKVRRDSLKIAWNLNSTLKKTKQSLLFPLISLHFAKRHENTVGVNYRAVILTIKRVIFAGAAVPVETLSPQPATASCHCLPANMSL